MNRQPFVPTFPSPPGDTILDLLEEHVMPQTELATRLGLTPEHLALLLEGEAALTDEVALGLEGIFGVRASFWNRREVHYRRLKASKAVGVG